MGSIDALIELALAEEPLSLNRWSRLSEAAHKGAGQVFLENFSSLVASLVELESFPERNPLMFHLGGLLNDAIDSWRGTLFGCIVQEDCDWFVMKICFLVRSTDKQFFRAFAEECVVFFGVQSKAARSAVDLWVLIGLRNKIVKDIRHLIAKLIWNARTEGEYS